MRHLGGQGERGDDVAALAFERMPDAVVVLDPDGTIVAANRAFAELVGCARERLVGRPLAAAFGVTMRDRVAAAIAGSTREGQLDVALGERGSRRLEWTLTPGLGGGRLLVTMRDVTERIRKGEAYERYEMLSRHAHDIVLFLGRDGRILEANDAAIAAYGYSREELLALSLRDLRAPSTRALIDEQVGRAFDAGILFETLHRRKDGTVFPVEVGSRAAIIGGERMLLSIIRDVSERSQMQAKLIQADRMGAVGTMAAGIAHEINNPLAYAMVNVQIARKKLAELAGALPEQPFARALDDVLAMLDLAHEGTERVRTIVGDLRTFARMDDAATGPAELPQVIETAINMASSEIRRRARLVRELGDAPAVDANPSRLVQVFLNLLVNAAQAIPEGAVEQNEIRVVVGTAPSGAAVVEVVDTGVGIAPDVIGRIFEPFFTTKPLGVGTGLGLFITQSIVMSAGGDIAVESAEGRGARFRVTLPAAEGRSSAALESAARRGRILVVDPDVELAATLRRRLEAHQVVSATSAEEVLALLDDDVEPDLVLSAFALPDGTALELCERIERARPALAGRFVVLSGADDPPDAIEVATRAGRLHLRKPFDVEAVAAMLSTR